VPLPQADVALPGIEERIGSILVSPDTATAGDFSRSSGT